LTHDVALLLSLSLALLGRGANTLGANYMSFSSPGGQDASITNAGASALVKVSGFPTNYFDSTTTLAVVVPYLDYLDPSDLELVVFNRDKMVPTPVTLGRLRLVATGSTLDPHLRQLCLRNPGWRIWDCDLWPNLDDWVWPKLDRWRVLQSLQSPNHLTLWKNL